MEDDGLEKVESWWRNDWKITCTIEYWTGDDNKAGAYWNTGTDWKFGGPAKPGYYLRIEFNPYDEGLAKRIHGWIRLVRPFRGPYGPGKIEQFWGTGKTGLEREILIDVKRTINSGLDGNLKTPIEILKEMWERLKKSAEKSKAFAERAKAKAKKVKAKANRAKAKAKKVKIDAKILRKKCQEIYQQEKTQQTKQEKADAVKAEAAAVKAEAAAVKAEDAARIAEYERVTAEKEAATAAATAIGDLEAVENISKIPEEKSEPLEEDEDELMRCGGVVVEPSPLTVPKYVKLAIPIVCVAVIIGVLMLGNGVNSFDGITEPFRGIIGQCELVVMDNKSQSIPIRVGKDLNSHGKISLNLCKDEGKEWLIVSGKNPERAQIKMTLLNPDLKYRSSVSYIDAEFDHKIEKNVYCKDDGLWRIKIEVDGKYHGDVLYFKPECT